jgi:hypothetical protein
MSMTVGVRMMKFVQDRLMFLFRLDLSSSLQSQFSLQVPCDPCFSDNVLISGEVRVSECDDDPSWSDTAKYCKENNEPEVECRVNDFGFAIVWESSEGRVNRDPNVDE